METYKNKKVLITGHTGFKGSWLSIWLNLLGAKVIGISNDIPSSPSNFITSNVKNYIDDFKININDLDLLKNTINKIQPDFIFHLAAQSLVRKSYSDPIYSFSTNTMGTVNILESLKVIDKSINVILITSDKVYKNIESKKGYSETDSLGGKDPYSASKAMAELAIQSYFNSFFQSSNSYIKLTTARSGNVIGGGDWAADRIIPDCMKSWSNNESVNIRNPTSTRPWQHVLETLRGYLLIGQNLYNQNVKHGEAYNFGPPLNQKNYSVGDLINELSKHWNKVKWKDISKNNEKFYESKLLKLNCEKALKDLNWKSILSFEEAVKMTIDWYINYYNNSELSTYEYTVSQIEEYSQLLKTRDLSRN